MTILTLIALATVTSKHFAVVCHFHHCQGLVGWHKLALGDVDDDDDDDQEFPGDMLAIEDVVVQFGWSYV